MAKKIDYASMFTLRKDGRYMGHYRDRDGKRHAVYDRDPQRLYEKIRQKEAPPPLSFRVIAEAWQERSWDSYRDGTCSAYAPALRRALEEFGDWPAAELGTPDIYAHLERLKALRLSARTIKAQRTVYKLIYKMAVADKTFGREITVNPAAGCPLPSGLPKAKKREAPDDDAVARIRAAASGPYGLLPLFLMSTGFRRGEALGVQWGDVDYTRMEIACRKAVSQRSGVGKIQETKTENAIRTVPILPDLEPLLIRPKGAKDTDFIFCGADPSKPMSQSCYERRWLQFCKAAGFAEDHPETRTSKQGKVYTVHRWKPTLTAHVLRHGYATLLFEADVDEFTAQKLLGHADITTTRAVYTHLRQRKQQASLDKLRAYVSKDIQTA